MSNPAPNYFAVIPAEVRYSDIPANAKLLYGELTALSNKEGFCWASNAYFAALYGVKDRAIREWMYYLEDKGFIRRVQGEERKIYITGGGGKTPGGRWKNTAEGGGKTPENKTSNNTKKGASPSFEVVQDQPEKKNAAPRDKEALRLRARLYDLFAKEHGTYPVISAADYYRVVSALKRLKPKEVETLVEDGLSQGKRTVSECLTDRAVTIYLQDN